MSNDIFISYRRNDTAPWAGRLYDRLSQVFPSDHIFLDVSGIEPGADFTKVLERQLAKCKVMLVLIGRHWLTARDAPGERPLDRPDDYVRIEIEAALARNIRIVPVLVDGAAMPSEPEVPGSLRGLCHRQAVELTHARFATDAQTLVESLARAALAEEEIKDAQSALLAQRPKPEVSRQKYASGFLAMAAAAGLVLVNLLREFFLQLSGIIQPTILCGLPIFEEGCVAVSSWHMLGGGGVIAIGTAIALVAASVGHFYITAKPRSIFSGALMAAAMTVAILVIFASFGVSRCGPGYIFKGAACDKVPIHI